MRGKRKPLIQKRTYVMLNDVRFLEGASIMTASELRANIYRLLDQVIETGVPLEIERKGQVLQVVLKEPPSRLDRLIHRDDFIDGDPDDLVHVDWSREWHG